MAEFDSDPTADLDAVRLDLRAVPPLGTAFFEAEVAGERVSAFVIRTAEGMARCYVNVCPHVPMYGLDFGDERIVDDRDGLIVCANHGARFSPESGMCVAGPCVGSALQSWPCREDATTGFVTVNPRPAPLGWPDDI